MQRVLPQERRVSTAFVDQSFHGGVKGTQDCRFGTIVRALWPIKPALHLAQRIGCSERAAQFYIDGQRKPSARALLAVMSAITQ
jgi:hypothetical protein